MSLHVTAASDISTHLVGLRINYSVPGDRAADASGAGFEPLPEIAALNSGQWPFYWVAALDVKSVRTPGTVVVFGDSITDGRCSTRDGATLIVQPNLYQRWGDRHEDHRVTVIPRGRPAPLTGWTGAMEAQRLLVNDWIGQRANFDGVIDLRLFRDEDRDDDDHDEWRGDRHDEDDD